MIDQANRTFICSVVFIDLVGYSKKPVAEQIRLKTSLTNNLSEAIKDIPVNDRIILDTGDGAAISFLGDPEDALFTSLSLRESMLRDRQEAGELAEGAEEDSMRTGIKRLKVTATGKLKRAAGWKRHKLEGKSPKRKRHLRKPAIITPADAPRLKALVPYL